MDRPHHGVANGRFPIRRIIRWIGGGRLTADGAVVALEGSPAIDALHNGRSHLRRPCPAIRTETPGEGLTTEEAHDETSGRRYRADVKTAPRTEPQRDSRSTSGAIHIRATRICLFKGYGESSAHQLIYPRCFRVFRPEPPSQRAKGTVVRRSQPSHEHRRRNDGEPKEIESALRNARL